MHTNSHTSLVARAIACAAGVLLASAAFAADNGVEVSAAEHAQLHSLRGAMPKNEELSKSRVGHPARPLP